MILDVDQIPHRCRDSAVSDLMAEAVRCYTVGAYRSVVVTTWIAVVFDFIAKLKELELYGPNGEARARLQSFEEARTAGDPAKALALEQKVLADARDVFGFLSPLEHDDLERLRADRHRCAHPAMRDEHERYEPTAEQARAHMRHALDFQLSRPPVQGKSALVSLQTQASQIHFPSDVDGAERVLKSGPLRRPRHGLVRNFLLSSLKRMLADDCNRSEAKRLAAAVEATAKMHPLMARETVGEHAWRARLTSELAKSNPRVWRLLSLAPFVQHALDEGHVEVLTQQASSQKDADTVLAVLYGVRIDVVAEKCRAKLGELSAKALKRAVAHEPRADLIPRAVELFVGSQSWDSANVRGEALVLPLVQLMTVEHAEKLVASGIENGEVAGSFVWARVVQALVDHQLIDAGDPRVGEIK